MYGGSQEPKMQTNLAMVTGTQLISPILQSGSLVSPQLVLPYSTTMTSRYILHLGYSCFTTPHSSMNFTRSQVHHLVDSQ